MDNVKMLERFTDNYVPKGDVMCCLPLGVPLEPFWQELLDYRKTKATLLPLHNAFGMPLWYVQTNKMVEASTRLSEAAIHADDSFDPYRASMTPALHDELYYTSFVEGAQIDLPDAMRFFEKDREPQNVQEQMLLNNKNAWDTMLHLLYRPIDEQILRALAFQLTSEMVGAADDYRTQDNIRIPAMAQEPYRVPPTSQIPAYMSELYAFIDKQDVHPLIRASAAHAFLLVTRPFPDGDERLSRMLSYSILLRGGYNFFRNVSLSKLIAHKSYAYFKAMREILRPENGGDLTYFIEYYMRLLADALEQIDSDALPEPQQAPTIITPEPQPQVSSVQFEQSRVTVQLTQPAPQPAAQEVIQIQPTEALVQNAATTAAEVMQASPFAGDGPDKAPIIPDPQLRAMLEAYFALYFRYGASPFTQDDTAKTAGVGSSTISKLLEVYCAIGLMRFRLIDRWRYYSISGKPAIVKSHNKKDGCNALRDQCRAVFDRFKGRNTSITSDEIQEITGITKWRADFVSSALLLMGVISTAPYTAGKKRSYAFTGRAPFDLDFIHAVFSPRETVEESITNAYNVLCPNAIQTKQTETPVMNMSATGGTVSVTSVYEDFQQRLHAAFHQSFSAPDVIAGLHCSKYITSRRLTALMLTGKIFKCTETFPARYAFENEMYVGKDGKQYMPENLSDKLPKFVGAMLHKYPSGFTTSQARKHLEESETVSLGYVDASVLAGFGTYKGIHGGAANLFVFAKKAYSDTEPRTTVSVFQGSGSRRIAASASAANSQAIQMK